MRDVTPLHHTYDLAGSRRPSPRQHGPPNNRRHHCYYYYFRRGVLLSVALAACHQMTGLNIAAAAATTTSNDHYDKSDLDHHLLNPIPKDPPTVDMTRQERFPSVEDRVKVYMSNWYLPPCHTQGKVRYAYWHNFTTTTTTSSSSTSSSSRAAKSSSSTTTITPFTTVWVQEPSNLRLTTLDHSSSSNSRNLSYALPEEYILESAIEPDKAFFLHRDTLLACVSSGSGSGGNSMPSTHMNYQDRIQQIRNMRLYCPDAAGSLLTALDHVLVWEVEQNLRHHQHHQQEPEVSLLPPIIVQFGDMRYSHIYEYMNVPLIKKFRSATAQSEIARVTTSNTTSATTSTPPTTTISQQSSRTESAAEDAVACAEHRDLMHTAHMIDSLQPIVWKLSSVRHFGMLHRIAREDTPWDSKINMAVFMGQLTGSVDGYNKLLSDEQNCMNLRRCRLVYTHANSSLIYARLTSTRNRLPPILNGIPLVTRKVSIGSLLQFKAIIMLEGNDVASGLKWALLSQSVVLMPPPKHTSWAMEELLVPWVHYIPLQEDVSDVEDKMQWVIENDEYAKRIAQRGSLWMQDLVFHPDAKEDDRLVQEEMLRRYVAHFQPLDDNESLSVQLSVA